MTESAQRMMGLIRIVRRMVDLDRAAAATTVQMKTEVKEEEEDWDTEAD